MGVAPQVDHLRFWSGSSLITELRVTKTTLTNDQIKTLPDTFPVISDTPPTGKLIWPVSIELVINASLGAYTNIHADAYAWAGSTIVVSPVDISEQAGYVANDATLTPPATGMTDLFGTASINGCLMLPLQRSDATITDWYQLAYVVPAYNSYWALPWSFRVQNNGAGDFTGGHASNTGTITFAYFIR